MQHQDKVVKMIKAYKQMQQRLKEMCLVELDATKQPAKVPKLINLSGDHALSGHMVFFPIGQTIHIGTEQAKPKPLIMLSSHDSNIKASHTFGNVTDADISGIPGISTRSTTGTGIETVETSSTSHSHSQSQAQSIRILLAHGANLGSLLERTEMFEAKSKAFEPTITLQLLESGNLKNTNTNTNDSYDINSLSINTIDSNEINAIETIERNKRNEIERIEQYFREIKRI